MGRSTWRSDNSQFPELFVCMMWYEMFSISFSKWVLVKWLLTIFKSATENVWRSWIRLLKYTVLKFFTKLYRFYYLPLHISCAKNTWIPLLIYFDIHMFIKYEEQTWKAFKWTTLLLSFMNPHLKNCIPLIAINFHAVCSFLQFYFRSKNARLW